MGDQVGRDLSGDADEMQMDRDVKGTLEFIRGKLK